MPKTVVIEGVHYLAERVLLLRPVPPAELEAYQWELPDFQFTPTLAEPVKRLEVPDLPSGVCQRLHLSLSFRINHWSDPSRDLHNLFWLGAPDNYRLAGYANLHGPKKSQALLRWGIEVKHEDKAKHLTKWHPELGVTYVLHYDYDATEGQVGLTVTGEPRLDILAKEMVRPFSLAEGMNLDLGFNGAEDGHAISDGFTYSDIALQLEYAPEQGDQ